MDSPTEGRASHRITINNNERSQWDIRVIGKIGHGAVERVIYYI